VTYLALLRVTFFFNSHSGGGGGSAQHVGHFWHIVPAPDDCEDGEFRGIKIARYVVYSLLYRL
jgi:hypothetical protein